MPLNLRLLQACQIPSLIRHRGFDVTEGVVLTEETKQSAHWILRLMQACEILPSSALEVWCNRGARVWSPTLRSNTHRQKESRHSGGTHTPFKKTHLDTNLELCDILLLLLGLHYRIRNTQVINQKSESLLSLFLPWKLKKNSCSSSHYSTYVGK